LWRNKRAHSRRFRHARCRRLFPELAYFECLYELDFIVDLIREAGISGMRKLISDTAKWCELTVGPKIINPTVQKRMRSVLQKIRSGQFAREFIREMKRPRKRYEHLLREAEKQPIEKWARDYMK
jgi:ketol-acid reductoisomerase